MRKTSTVSVSCAPCRCPIKVTVEDGAVRWIEGNPHQLKGALCAKGSAGTALLNDPEEASLSHDPGRRSGRREMEAGELG